MNINVTLCRTLLLNEINSLKIVMTECKNTCTREKREHATLGESCILYISFIYR